MSDDGDPTSAPPRALRLLVDELRAEEPPAVDWDLMESRLLARIEAEPSAGVEGSRAVGPSAVDTSGVVDLLGGAPGHSSASPRSGTERAEVLVPWDDEEDASWRSVRRPPVEAPPTRALRRARDLPLRRGRWAAAFAAIAVAAAAVWALAPSQALPVAEPVDLASVAREPRIEGALDLASLRGGDLVEATEGPVRFGRDGVLTWTLSAGGRLRVVSGIGHEEPRHVVALEYGALDVEVVPLEHAPAGPPSTPAERFVVEVGGARVAVHGTAFRVVRSTQGIVVDVSRGVVAVGPREGAPGSGQRLEAPQRAAFGLDGRGYRTLPARSADVASTDERYAGASVELVATERDRAESSGAIEDGAAALGPGSGEAPDRRPGAGEPGGATAAPSSGAPGGGRGAPSSPAASAATPDRIGAEVASCIRRAGAASSDARVTVSSSLVVDVDAGGAPRSVRFDPPIRPDLQACAQSVFGRRFSGAGHVVVPIEVVLEPR